MSGEEENMKQKCAATAMLGAAFVAVPSLVYAQVADIGKREYVNSCAVCHGDSGRGDGPLVKSLKIAPTDLTRLQKSNNGVFPIGRVYEVIDGRKAVAGHGSRDMPVWGDRFKERSTEQAELALRFGISIDAEAFAGDRILALIRYLSSLQER
jgi:mono/diheme cytochrome c family protein